MLNGSGVQCFPALLAHPHHVHCLPTHPPTPLPPQARIVGLNAQYFLKNGGGYVISIKASCIDSTAPPEAVFAREVTKLRELQLKPKEQVRACVCVCVCVCVCARVCWPE
jgi:hypothetical protein